MCSNGHEHDRVAMVCPDCGAPTGAARRAIQDDLYGSLVERLGSKVFGKVTIDTTGRKPKVEIETDLTGWDVLTAASTVSEILGASGAAKVNGTEALAGFGSDFTQLCAKLPVIRAFRVAVERLVNEACDQIAVEVADEMWVALEPILADTIAADVHADRVAHEAKMAELDDAERARVKAEAKATPTRAEREKLNAKLNTFAKDVNGRGGFRGRPKGPRKATPAGQTPQVPVSDRARSRRRPRRKA
jgi:hypothetical protein